MPRNHVIVTTLRFLALMRRPVRPTAKEVARELGVSERQAKRYFAACAEAHIAMPPTVRDLERAS